MKVPRLDRLTTRQGLTKHAAALCVALALPMVAAAAAGAAGSGGANKGDMRPLAIPVEELGFQVLPLRYISTTATLYTVHFVDEQHLLFTFTVRSLLKRMPDAEPDDDDRNVAAVLLELPTGKVVARTEWRMRDHDRYLWPLGHGRFLLRTRSRLSVIDPMRNLAAGDAFRGQELLDFRPRQIGYLSVMPGGDLVGVETIVRKPKLTGVAADAAALAATDPDYKPKRESLDEPKVEILFYRLVPENADGSGRLLAHPAGRFRAQTYINLPVTGEGHLDIKRESAGSWTFDFVSYTQKRTELAGYETSCAPTPYFVSRSEFVAFGCRGSSDRVELSYFNLKGEEPWVSTLGGNQVSPMIIAAPAAGRFAMSRTLVNDNAVTIDSLNESDLMAQEITVQQSHDGRVLLKVQATPIQRAGQNFDLSPLGTQFAILRAGNLEVYALPPLTGKDRKAVEVAQSLAPAAVDIPVELNFAPVEAAKKPEAAPGAAEAKKSAGEVVTVSTAEPVPPTPAVLGAAPAALPESEMVQQGPAANAGASSEGASGDTQGISRKRPSLYSPEYPPAKGDAAAKQKQDPNS